MSKKHKMKRDEFMKLLGLGAVCSMIPCSLKSAPPDHAILLDERGNILARAYSVSYQWYGSIYTDGPYVEITLKGKIENYGKLANGFHNSKRLIFQDLNNYLEGECILTRVSAQTGELCMVAYEGVSIIAN